MKGAPPRTTAEWVAAAIEAERSLRNRPRVMSDEAPLPGELRAQLNRTTFLSTSAGKTHLTRPGERVILGPTGEKIRIVETPTGGNQLEHGDHLHAVIRPGSAAVHSKGMRS